MVIIDWGIVIKYFSTKDSLSRVQVVENRVVRILSQLVGKKYSWPKSPPFIPRMTHSIHNITKYLSQTLNPLPLRTTHSSHTKQTHPTSPFTFHSQTLTLLLLKLTRPEPKAELNFWFLVNRTSNFTNRKPNWILIG